MSGKSSNAKIPGCCIHHVSIHTRDLAAAVVFYRDVLGMEPVAEFEVRGRPMVLLDVGDGSHVELCAPVGTGPVPEPSAILAHVALATTDVAAAVERVRAAGCPITVEPKDVNLSGIVSRVAFCEGPSGEVIEFFEVR